ncbi:transcription factor TFIIIB component B [Zygosaccharomyces mellis]|uniref:Transcription factor TFIIIB component B n=1 Tax=Zygosaccharomyces mellis TaxID=42258 RepID=A0A4C2E2B5_9SACH|nr:transcription factor TFIIIB component B [Zygosaccharomyces mellis]
MSSVVNKSGTRFAPKVKPRSVPATIGTVKRPPPTANSVKPTNNDDTAMAEKDVYGDADEQDSEEDPDIDESRQNSPGKSALTDNESTQVSSPSAGKSSAPLQTSTQLSIPSTASQRRRSSRLDSLTSASSGRPLFKPNFEENLNEGRLSGISNSAPKKARVTTIPEKDAALQALKRRRMSIRSAATRKPGAAKKIGIVSKIDDPDSELHTATAISNPEQKREPSADLFQRTDSLYERYTIRSLKEIPKDIQDTDSQRYMIDEQEFTMAELCKPKLPIGTPSENFERAKLAGKLKFQKRQSRRELRRKAREEFKSLKSLNKEQEEKELEGRKEAREKLLQTEVPEYTQPQSALQLKMSQDGTMVVDEESTVVDRHRNATFENRQKERVDENPFENLYNSSTYGRNVYTDPWTTEELIKLYKSLSMWGTDFNLIAQLFPYRTRKQIKAKFINEERKHPVIIELALRSRLPADFDQYCLDTKKEIGTVSEFNEKLEQIKARHEEEMKEIEAAKANAKEEDSKHVKNVGVIGKKSSGGFRTDELKAYRKTEVVLGTIDDIRRKKEEEVAEEV